jgi:hypothetical protein
MIDPMHIGGDEEDSRKYSLAPSEGLRSNSLVPIHAAEAHVVAAGPAGGTGAGDALGANFSTKTADGGGAEESNSHPHDESLSENAQDDLDDCTSEENSALANIQQHLPERQVDAVPISSLAFQALNGQLLIETDGSEVGNAFRTKMRFRDVDGWLSEVGLVPAGVVALVSGGGGASSRDRNFRLTAKQLEQNHRLILQLKSRTTTHSYPRTPQASGQTGPNISNPFAVANNSSFVAPAVSDALTVTNSQALNVMDPVDDEARRYSRQSNNRVPGGLDRNADIGMTDFYEELEEEERRLSTIKNSSSED